jgi:NAD(P)-dependent dehydrogenase (short-subunit alcohol dehydrogenase family)
VAIWDLTAGAARAVADELRETCGTATVAVEIDLAHGDGIAEAVRVSRDALGPIGGLVHSAGVVYKTPIDDVGVETWDVVMDVNVRAAALIVRALLSELRAAGPGSAVVGISSIMATLGVGEIASYCASKGAMLGLVHALAAGLGRDGIRVNAVCPGYIDTPLTPTSAAAEERYREIIPLGRLGEASEIASVVRFLLSDEAGYVTGAEIVIDGGLTRHTPRRSV